MDLREVFCILIRMFGKGDKERYPMSQRAIKMMAEMVSNGERYEMCECCIKKLIDEVKSHNALCKETGGEEITSSELESIVEVLRG